MRTQHTALGILVFITLLLPWSRPVEATPSNEVWRYYFSDSSLEDQVGQTFVTSCYGVVNYTMGQTSSHYVSTSESCSSGSSSMEIDCYVNGHITTCPANICDNELFGCE